MTEASGSKFRGHLFIIDGDLNRVVCDAVLVPTSSEMEMSTGLWKELLTKGFRERTAAERTATWKVVRDPGAEASGPEVWFGNVGAIGQDQDPAPYADVAEAFVRGAASRLFGKHPLPRVALNVLGSGEGGIRENKGALMEALVGRLLTLAATEQVDIVLVTFGQRQYAAAQRARLRLQPEPCSLRELIDAPDIPLVEKTIDQLAATARDHQLVLFVGAGVSTGAGLPKWQDLLDELARAAKRLPIDIDRLRTLDVRDQAQVLLGHYGAEELQRLLVERFSTTKYSLAHGLLTSMDPHEVVTTNYDKLIEYAFGGARQPAVLPMTAVGPDGRWLLKLHGSVDKPSSMVLTRDDYMGLPMNSQALLGILQAMMMTKHLLFIGYSLTDDTFHRVVHDVRSARSTAGPTRFGTAMTLFDDPLLTELWGKELTFVPVAKRPAGTTPSDEDIAAASRSLDIVLDRVGAKAADVTAFLLDDTYFELLDPHECELRDQLRTLMTVAGNAGPIGQQVNDMLSALNSTGSESK